MFRLNISLGRPSILVLFTAIFLQACIAGKNQTRPKNQEKVANNDQATLVEKLGVSPARVTIEAGQTHLFSITGGVPPYRVLNREARMIDQLRLEWRASLIVSMETLIVEDSQGQRASSSIQTIIRSGAPDLQFGGDGILDFSVGGHNQAGPLAEDLQKRIVSLGMSLIDNLWQLTIRRLNSNGVVDRSFGSDGLVLFPNLTQPTGVYIQADGKVLVLARDARWGPGYLDMMLVRLHEDGSLDSDYAHGGLLRILHKGELSQGHLQEDGRMLLLSSEQTERGALKVWRVNRDGELDESFGSRGTWRYEFPHAVISRDIKEGLDGKIYLLADRIEASSGVSHFFLMILNSSGDPGFLHLNSSITLPCSGRALAFQRGNPIVLAKVWNGPRSSEGILLGRFEGNGALDLSFGSDGITIHPTARDRFFDQIDIDQQGRILVGGTGREVGSRQNHDVLIMRFLRDGERDESLGEAGLARIEGNTSDDQLADLLIDRDGRILSAFTSDFSQTEVLHSIARIWP